MAPDDPLSALLPKLPLPRPDRREAAIGMAMRRFDGTDETPFASGQRRPGAKRTWLAAPWRSPQLGAVLAAAMVGLIVLPLWTSREHRPELAGPAATSIETERAAPGHEIRQRAPSPPARLKVEAAPAAADREAGLAAAPPPQTDQETAAQRSEKPAAPSQLDAFVDTPMEQEGAIGSASRRAAGLAPPAVVLAEPVAPPAPPPPASSSIVADRRERDKMSNEVIATAKRLGSTSDEKVSAVPQPPQAQQTSRSGDWNACTVNDPARSLKTCGKSASRNVAAGLYRAWQGDLDGAIAEFDQAIAASPQPGLAYLNRGLAYERKGDAKRALADLDQAVHHMPNSARAYYHRSLVLRRRGEKDRAKADAARAIELDARYRAVIR